METRSDKIRFLQGIQDGSRKVRELKDTGGFRMIPYTEDETEFIEWDGELLNRKELERTRGVILVAATEEIKRMMQVTRTSQEARSKVVIH